jgi:excisionase family DNA binding protein
MNGTKKKLYPFRLLRLMANTAILWISGRNEMLMDHIDTVMPSQQDVELAATASRSLSRQKEAPLRVRLDDESELTLPKAATRLLAHLLTEMAQGNAVTLIPLHAELTTRQAADYLNVSRPHVVKLIDQKQIPCHKVGTHRRVRFTDLRDFKLRHEQARSEALDALAAEAQELGMGY